MSLKIKNAGGGGGSSSGGSGQYAWEKKERKETTTNVDVTVTAIKASYATSVPISINPTGYTITASDIFGLTLTDSSNSANTIVFNSDYTAYYMSWGSVIDTFSWSYSESSMTITISLDMSNEFSGSKTVVKQKTTITEVTIGYVVSDDSSAYPNNATHTDGYYYTQIS